MIGDKKIIITLKREKGGDVSFGDDEPGGIAQVVECCEL